jgi:hypothetical protein
MQFTLRFLLLTFLLVALCFAVFDRMGLVIGLALTGIAAYACRTKIRAWSTTGLVLVLGLGLLILMPAVVNARRAATRTATVRNLKLVVIPGIPEVALGLRNYHARFGYLPPVQERDDQGQPRHSWRALILQGYVVKGCSEALASRYDFDEAWNGPNNGKLGTEYPRQPTCLAVVGEDGDWLRPTSGTNPVQVVEDRDFSIRPISWLEPRDLTVEEACQAIHVPLPSGSLAIRLVSEEPPGVRALFADGTELWIPVHTPLPVLRAALLGDRAKQRELGSYRNAARRLRWFDYLTLAGLVACWVGMIRATPRRRPEAVGWVERAKENTAKSESVVCQDDQ